MSEQDAMWAALADPDKQGGQWAWDEFLQHGRAEVEDHFARLARLGIAVRSGRALDFGCGPGRLAQALVPRFREVHAIDISEEMLARARALLPPDARLVFHWNPNPDLALFPSDHFSFVLSMLVLQHIPARYTKRYLVEIVRVLEPGGVAIVQLPSHPAPSSNQFFRERAPAAVRNLWRLIRAGGKPVMGAYAVPQGKVLRLLARAGADVCEASKDRRAGWHWASYTYVFRKRDLSTPINGFEQVLHPRG